MASSGSPIVFGSINQSESESIPAGSEAVTFGSIPASKKVPKEEIISTSALPTSTTHVQDMHVSESASYKHPPHIPHQLGHGQHSHRRTDSTSSGNGDTNHHFRAQVPPTISQASAIPNLGVPVSASYPQRPPIKTPGGMGPVNPQSHHGHPHHTHIPQWSQNYYMPTYDPGYYQPMYQPPISAYGGQPRPMATRPFNTNAPSFTPKAQPSRRITIINPLTGTEVTPVPAPTPSDAKSHSKANLVAKPEEDAKPIFTAPTKSIIRIVNPAEKEREEHERKEKEEKSRKEREEKERLEREEKERIIRDAKEAEERRIREEQEEKERLEALARAEQERKEREEREQKEREERERKEKEEREEHERLEAEQKRKEEEERIVREKAEAEAKAKAEAEAEAEAKAAAAEKARIEKERVELEAKERAQKLEAERHAQEAEKLKQEHAKAQAKASTPTPPPDSAKAGLTVDLSRTSSAPSGASARIENFGAVSYPSHIQSPAPDGQGKFRYNRDFLMQFMTVCTDKPDSLPSLEVLGGEDNHRQPPGSSRGSRGLVSNNRGKPSPMGSFKVGDRPTGMPLGMRQMSGDARLNRSPSENQFLPRNNYNNNNNILSRPPSQRGSRGGRRGGGRGGHHGHQDSQLTIPLADIVPLEKTENAWTPNVNASQATATISADEPLNQEQVARKVKGLLNKLTLEKFDSISDKIIDIANLSAKEEDGTTLKHCIQIIFEKATDEPNFGSVYARLCQKLMDKVSEDVKDKTVQGSAGGKLFRKYLLHRCQEEFVKGWKDKAAANGVSLNDKDGPDLMSDEYYIMMKAKRQGLGLIHFIGELFKLQMLTEKIMHECVKKLLANVKDPEEEETEGLCKLMTTVGLQLDRPEAKSHIDVYFARMTELTKNMKLASRIRFMVQDVIDLRANNWVNRRAASGPKTIAAIHEEAARQQEEKELIRRTASSGGGRGLPNRREQLNRGQSFRGSGDARHDHGGVPPVGADGWSTVATTMTKKAGDLSSFGNTSRSKVSGLPSLGLGGSVFGALNKSKREAKVAAQSEPRSTTITSANSFSALEGGEEKPVERRRLNLLPRSTPVPENEGEAKQPETEAPKKTEDEAKRSIANTLKEFMSIKDMSELLISVRELDACYRSLLVTEFVNQSMEMKSSEVDSIADIFKKLGSEKVVSEQDFEAGFSDPLEFLPDTAIDVPNAFKIMAQLLEAAGMDPARAKA
ncbi:MAG: hypothetical protein BYD32DRAFT_485925 [Podila humilis]|nr:MAG: hypothetical protein BYD32DRAFT_485925 [Podila humilis]